ncbi:PRC-barrel domain-containing protein [Aeoliella mucimassa]|uniref:PRC-barrel domain protein n=1 Tax=Aeoliella mucimassa TaxID=2527972 RepID=A0A518AI83_9BACT|nr:PRC-barrel domain-containing protein [Aeoliella mucimassa]QDU54384.1 PRC-barrel domain protein [Aeoliella mucimassa]
MRILSLTTALITSGAISLTSLSPAMAQDGNAQQRQARRATVSSAKLDETTRGNTVRASHLIGMNIVNREGEDIAQINDLVLDAKTGRINYVAVQYGGFLGMGDKLFAVPYDALHVRHNPNADASNHDAQPVLMLNVTERQLEGAEGFDQDQWPDFSDRDYTGSLQKRYGVGKDRADRNRDRDRDGGVNVDIGRRGINVDVGDE